MAEQQDIIVRANEEQKKNFTDIGFYEPTAKDKYYKKLVQKQQECTELHVHFCYLCAKQDFEDACRKAASEITRGSFTREERETKQKKIPLDLKELEEYAKPSYFTLLGSRVQNEPHIVDGMKVNRPSFMEYNYKCKSRNHGMSVHVPWLEHLEKEKTGKK